MTGAGKPLEVTAVKEHHPGPGQVRISNHAIAIQPLDVKILIGGYGPASQLNYPAVLGTSGSGVVEELGDQVTGHKVGDRVVFDTNAYVKSNDNLRTGTWQQQVICDAQTIAKVCLVEFITVIM